jgi:hypothetical protein
MQEVWRKKSSRGGAKPCEIAGLRATLPAGKLSVFVEYIGLFLKGTRRVLADMDWSPRAVAMREW